VLFLWEPSRVRSGGCDVVVSKADHLRRKKPRRNAAAFTIHHADSLSFSVAWLRSRPNWSIDYAVLRGSSAPERVRPSRAPEAAASMTN
jgi:hypothetical protein